MSAEKVRERAKRTAAALEAGGVPYAVIGGNAVGEWVGRVDDGAVRNTKDVDILLRRADLPAANAAMRAAGFIPDEVIGIPIFLDGPDGKPSQAVHVILANEKVKPNDAVSDPDVDDSEEATNFRVLSLEALVRMKLVSNRDKDRTHVRDIIGVGLIDETWPARFTSPLAERLQGILDTPNG